MFLTSDLCSPLVDVLFFFVLMFSRGPKPNGRTRTSELVGPLDPSAFGTAFCSRIRALCVASFCCCFFNAGITRSCVFLLIIMCCLYCLYYFIYYYFFGGVRKHNGTVGIRES